MGLPHAVVLQRMCFIHLIELRVLHFRSFISKFLPTRGEEVGEAVCGMLDSSLLHRRQISWPVWWRLACIPEALIVIWIPNY